MSKTGYYKVTIWTGKDGSSEGQYEDIVGIISKKHIKKWRHNLEHGKKYVIKVIVNDGEVAYLPSNTVSTVTEDFSANYMYNTNKKVEQ